MHYRICKRLLGEGKGCIKSMFSYKSIGPNKLFFKPRFFDSINNEFIELKEAGLLMGFCDSIDKNGQRYRFLFKSNDTMFSTNNEEEARLIFEVDDG